MASLSFVLGGMQYQHKFLVVRNLQQDLSLDLILGNDFLKVHGVDPNTLFGPQVKLAPNETTPVSPRESTWDNTTNSPANKPDWISDMDDKQKRSITISQEVSQPANSGDSKTEECDEHSGNQIQRVDCIEGTEDQACEDSDDNFEEETFPPPIRLFTKGTPDKGYSQEALSGKEQNPRTLYQTCVCTLESQEVMYKTWETSRIHFGETRMELDTSQVAEGKPSSRNGLLEISEPETEGRDGTKSTGQYLGRPLQFWKDILAPERVKENLVHPETVQMRYLNEQDV